MDIDDLSWPKTTGEVSHSHLDQNDGHDNEHVSYKGVKDNRDPHIWLSPKMQLRLLQQLMIF